jgi:ubiquinone/menaquinone biosynthesis C-methylase UbiE
MSDFSFRTMCLIFKFVDSFYSYIDKRIENFGIKPGMAVVDYGCGPGRYTFRFARMVGGTGKVFATDIHELAISMIKKRAAKEKTENIIPVLTDCYRTSIPEKTADIICALDMFFMVADSQSFLAELHRICKTDGLLIIDDGHQPRQKSKKAILNSGLWLIEEETADHMKCKPA